MSLEEAKFTNIQEFPAEHLSDAPCSETAPVQRTKVSKAPQQQKHAAVRSPDFDSGSLSSAPASMNDAWVQKGNDSPSTPLTPSTPDSPLTPEAQLVPEISVKLDNQMSPLSPESTNSAEFMVNPTLAVITDDLPNVATTAPDSVNQSSGTKARAKSSIVPKVKSQLSPAGKANLTNPESLWLFKGVASFKGSCLPKRSTTPKPSRITPPAVPLPTGKATRPRSVPKGTTPLAVKHLVTMKGKSPSKQIVVPGGLKGQTCPPCGVATPKGRSSPDGRISPDSPWLSSGAWHERSVEPLSERDRSSDKERSSDLAIRSKDWSTVRDFRIAKDWGPMGKQWDAPSEQDQSSDPSSDKEVASEPPDLWVVRGKRRSSADDQTSGSSGAGQEPEPAGSATPDLSAAQWAQNTRQALKESRQALVKARTTAKEASTSDESQAGEESEDNAPPQANLRPRTDPPSVAKRSSKYGFWSRITNGSKGRRSKPSKK